MSPPTHRHALVILGMHRSGTSALTRTLSLLGASLPKDMLPPKENDNALGFWEPRAAFEHNERLLAQLDSRWDDWRPLPSVPTEFRPGPVYDEQLTILRREYGRAPLAVIKDPRMCRLLPYWSAAIHDGGLQPLAVMAVRHPLEVADSLARRNGFSINRGLLLWLRHCLDAEWHSRELPRAVVNYAALLTDWRATTTRVGEQLALSWPVAPDDAAADIEAFLSSRHRHEQRDVAALSADPHVFHWVRVAYSTLERLETSPDDAAALAELDALRCEFNEACTIFGPEWRASEQDVSRLQGELAKSKRQTRDVEAHAGRLENRLQEARNGLHVEQRARTEAEKHLAGAVETRSRLLVAIDRLNQQIDERTSALAQHADEIARLRRENEDGRAQVAQSLAAANDSEARAKTSDAKAAKSQARADAAIRECDRLRQSEQKLSRTLSKVKTEASALHSQQQHVRLIAGNTFAELLRQAGATPEGSRLRRAITSRRAVGMRQIRAQSRVLNRIRHSGVFDRAWYLAQNPDIARSGIDPLVHWCAKGWRENRAPGPGFDPRWYRVQNPDVEIAGVNPLDHYIEFGWRENRRPCPAFEPAWYLREHPDVAKHDLEPLSHYLQQGRHEGRKPSIWFDASWFANQWGVPVEHAWSVYCAFAHQFPIAPTPYFDAPWYAAKFPDVLEHGWEPLSHFLAHGAREGRDPNPFFAARWYRERHPGSNDNPLIHYLTEGRKANNDPHPDFSIVAYRQRYPQVVEAGVEPLWHYLVHGHREGRNIGPMPPALQGLRPPASRPADRNVVAVVPDAETRATAQATIDSHPKHRFSIIMPCWNRGAVIADAIASVLAQSYPHWQLIVCDDGSTDDTVQVIKESFQEAIAAGQIIVLELPHQGVSAARNAGLERADAPWVGYLDSDNRWHPDYLLLTAAAFLQQPEVATHYAALQVDDAVQGRRFIRSRSFDWDDLLQRNFIDLNIFAHHRRLFTQLGGFDTTLRRLVDWDLILRYTERHPPAFSPYVLADYQIAESLNNITLTEPLEANELALRRKFLGRPVRGGLPQLKLAYVIWDWPALSQTFVMAEIREWLGRGADVRVYFHSAPDKPTSAPPPVPATRIEDADSLAQALRDDGRNWIHAHFAYPTVTRLVWPAAESTGLPFSFMPHAVDIFHHANRERNRIAEVGQSPHCARIFVHGDYHRNFLVDQGVPAEKISYTAQACDLNPLLERPVTRPLRQPGEALRLVTSARLIEKKGLHHLLEALALCAAPTRLTILGYGPQEDALKAQAAEAGLANQVSFAGAYDGYDALTSALAAADLFCLPCCEAENGDLDGMPTVLLEAMALGVPVLTTHVSAIPEYISDGITGFLVPPADPVALAHRLDALSRLDTSTLAAVGTEARARVPQLAGAPSTVDSLQDVLCEPPLDIFMVSFHREKYGDWPATERALRSVLDHTTTPFTLTIVDNDSDADFVDKLEACIGDDPRVRFIRLPENRYCGPASNIAITMARSALAIYVCSNEGLIMRRGWERPVLDAMRRNPEATLGGHLATSPKWFDGQTYAQQDWIDSFRNASFARNNPDRVFRHVQGGLFVLRTQRVQDAGGFSPQRPQDLMDVELSYYLESLGHRLLDIPAITAVSNKTRPNLEALIDETSLALHPVLDDALDLARHVHQEDAARCNICGWSGHVDRDVDGVSFDCPACGSAPRDRSLYRALADSHWHHRGLRINLQAYGEPLQNMLKGMFVLTDGDDVDVDPSTLPACRPSRVLGIPPAYVPQCNICGHTEFGQGPNGRASVEGDCPPRCLGCQSLERHRAFRAAMHTLGRARFERRTVLQFSQDPALPAEWQIALEVSIYDGPNSLDLQAVDRPDASYDVVICNHVLEHVADDVAALRELVRIVRPDGFVFLSFPDPLRYDTTHNWGKADPTRHGHYRVYGKDVAGFLRSTLPDIAMLSGITRDPVTGTREAYSILSPSLETARSLAADIPHATWISELSA